MNDEELPAGRELDRRVHARLFQGEAAASDELPRYSADLAASFRVVEALRRLGYRVDVNLDGDVPSVTLTSPLDDPQEFAGGTPAEALCHAALAVTSGFGSE
jgi:hypothetical protein